ncbi:hypothetical protein HAY16_000718 [Salmonella enterica]|nr:hypothetical protein [Salmonella enterica]EEP1113469.1 hypothetical protein [Salmonella enterica]
MKRKFVIIYILMIAVGIIGLFSISNDSVKEAVSEVPMKEQSELVEVKKAVATHDLTKGKIINKNDYKIEVTKVSKVEAEKYKNENTEELLGWAVKDGVSKGTTLSISSGTLARPETQEFYELFTIPGNIIYTFTLGKSDSFLLDNVKAGSGIDVYLIYGFEQRGDISQEEIMSPPSSVMRRGLKRIIQNKKILGVHRADKQKKNGIENVADGSQIVVELNEQDIKILKALELNTHLILLPASDKELTNDNITIDDYLPVYEGSPLDNQYSLPEVSLEDMQKQTIGSGSGVNELRG